MQVEKRGVNMVNFSHNSYLMAALCILGQLLKLNILNMWELYLWCVTVWSLYIKYFPFYCLSSLNVTITTLAYICMFTDACQTPHAWLYCINFLWVFLLRLCVFLKTVCVCVSTVNRSMCDISAWATCSWSIAGSERSGSAWILESWHLSACQLVCLAVLSCTGKQLPALITHRPCLTLTAPVPYMGTSGKDTDNRRAQKMLQFRYLVVFGSNTLWEKTWWKAIVLCLWGGLSPRRYKPVTSIESKLNVGLKLDFTLIKTSAV